MGDTFHAVLSLDDLTVVSIKTSAALAMDMAHTLANHPVTPVRNILIVPVTKDLYVARALGVGVELVLEEQDNRIVPIVRIAERRAADPPRVSTESLLRAALTPSKN